MSWKKVNMKKLLIVFCSIAVIGIGYYLLVNNEDGKAREIRIIAEYQAIKHPEGAKTVHYELFKKFIIRSIYTKYTLSISDDDLKRYYDKELTSKGWQQGRSRLEANNVYYYYTKDNLELVVEKNASNAWKITIHYIDAKY